MTEYPASAMIPGKHPEPCGEYERDCQYTECSTDFPPHCAKCGYVKEDHDDYV